MLFQAQSECTVVTQYTRIEQRRDAGNELHEFINLISPFCNHGRESSISHCSLKATRWQSAAAAAKPGRMSVLFAQSGNGDCFPGFTPAK